MRRNNLCKITIAALRFRVAFPEQTPVYLIESAYSDTPRKPSLKILQYNPSCLPNHEKNSELISSIHCLTRT